LTKEVHTETRRTQRIGKFLRASSPCELFLLLNQSKRYS